MSSTRTALVIGGGIAGPATAMALQKAGIDAVVYERYPTAADRVGAFLTLASNGVDALRVMKPTSPCWPPGSPPHGSRSAAAPGSGWARAGSGTRFLTARPVTP